MVNNTPLLVKAGLTVRASHLTTARGRNTGPNQRLFAIQYLNAFKTLHQTFRVAALGQLDG